MVASDFVMQVPSPCSLLYDPCPAKTQLQKYSHEMSTFCCFLNLSWDLEVLLTSCCPPEMDELVNVWPGEGESWNSHSASLGSDLKDGGKMGGMPCLFRSRFSRAS